MESILIDGEQPHRALTSTLLTNLVSISANSSPVTRIRLSLVRPTFCVTPQFKDNATERVAPGWHRRPGLPQPGVAVPQSLSAEGIPDSDTDHVGPRSLSDGPGKPHLGRQLRGSGSHHISQGATLLPFLGRFLREYIYFSFFSLFYLP